jgi:hypothetical protein
VFLASVLKRKNMFRKTLFAAIAIFLAFACHHDQLEEGFNSKLVIKTGTVCGWCSMNDTLTVSGNTLKYVNYTQCNNSKPSVAKNGQITDSELETLLAQFDFNEFKKLDLNSSNISFDGCDDWLFYQNGTQSHYIRFTRNDPKLQPVQAFVDQLNVIKSKMQ